MKKTIFFLAALGLGISAQAQTTFDHLKSNQGYDKILEFDMNTNSFNAQGYRLISMENNNGLGAVPTLDFEYKQGGTWFNSLSIKTDRVGIGTNLPQETLHVEGLIRIPFANNSNNNSPGIVASSNADFLFSGRYLNTNGIGFYKPNTFTTPGAPAKNHSYMSGLDGVDFFTDNEVRLRIKKDGNVGIGTSNPIKKLHVNGDSYITGNLGIGSSNPDAKLTVRGDIHAEEVRIDLNVPADYVFQKYFTGESSLKESYHMPTLEEVAQFAKENHHLPNIPSASQIQEEGLVVGEMTNLLLQKIEELTLYTIEQENRIKLLEKKVSMQE